MIFSKFLIEAPFAKNKSSYFDFFYVTHDDTVSISVEKCPNSKYAYKIEEPIFKNGLFINELIFRGPTLDKCNGKIERGIGDTVYFFKNGLLHNDLGPAVIDKCDSSSLQYIIRSNIKPMYYLNGINFSQKEFLQKQKNTKYYNHIMINILGKSV